MNNRLRANRLTRWRIKARCLTRIRHLRLRLRRLDRSGPLLLILRFPPLRFTPLAFLRLEARNELIGNRLIDRTGMAFDNLIEFRG